MHNKNILTASEGQRLVDEFYNNNLKPGEFCQQKNISYYILRYWRRKYSNKNSPKNNLNSKSVNPKFLPINLISSNKLTSSSIKISINSKINVELAGNIDLLQFIKNIFIKYLTRFFEVNFVFCKVVVKLFF